MRKKQLVMLLMAFTCHMEICYGQVNVQVNIEGLSGKLLDNTRALLSIEQQKDHPSLSETRLKSLHQKASREISKALQPFGYYHAQIQSQLSQDQQTWIATYTITPGPAVIVSSLDLQLQGEGREDAAFQQLIEAFPIQQGEMLEHARYEQGKRTLQRLAAERGYLDAHLTAHEIQLYLEENRAIVIIGFETGPRYQFGEVLFEPAILKPELLARFVPFKKGSPYSTRKLLDLQNALMDSDYFHYVEISPRRDLEQGRVIPIQVNLEARKKHKYTFGIGYGTDTGARGSIGWENRRINRHGHRLQTQAEVAEISQSISAAYTLPLQNPRSDRLAFSVGWEEEHPQTSDSNKLVLGVNRTISPRSGWLRSIYLNYQRESFRVGGISDDTTLVTPGISWSRIKADNRVDTRRGSSLILDLRGGSTSLGSDLQFVQQRFQGKLIRPMIATGRLIVRAEVGSTQIEDDAFTELPASLRFFAGGDQSVRGYGYRELGPTNAAGLVVGGKHLLTSSVEYEHPVKGKWSGAIFFDAGNALDDFGEKLKRGAGIGMRWRTLIGAIRLDLAWALSEPDLPARLHLMIGPDL